MGGRSGLAKFSLGRLRCPRQQDHSPSPLAGFAFDVNQPPVCSDNAADRGKPQTSTSARALGGEKGLKEPLAGFRVHAVAIVRNDQQHAREEDGTLAVSARVDPATV